MEHTHVEATGSGQRGSDHAQALAFRERPERAVGERRRDHDLGEHVGHRSCRVLVRLASERHDPPERAHRVGLERRRVRGRERTLDGRAAGVVVLDDHRRRPEAFEVGRERERGVDVQPVVERHLLALDEHLRAAEHPGPTRPPVQRSALVRVLAVPEVDHLLERESDERRHRVVVRREPPRDRGVVRRRVRERLGGQLAPLLQRQATVGLDGVDDRRRSATG